jgi:chromosomal replication initiator protein
MQPPDNASVDRSASQDRQALRALSEILLAKVQPHLSADGFQRWFSAVELVGADEERLVFRVPDSIYQFWIESNYLHLLKGAALEILGAPREIRFEADAAQAKRGAAQPAAEVAPVPEAAEVAEVTPPETEGEAKPGTGGLNVRYTFDTFVVGESNRVAHAAAMAVAQHPGRTYNPLFVHGGVGLGKTHLMQAIGHFATTKKRTAKVVYVSSERFTNEFIDAIQNSTLVRFRRKYRQADVLLIDDIQFLATRERTQEEFFHTFNTLMEGHKQIVLSSDRPPAEISNLEQRLVSRFEWGMTCELVAPDAETRLAILRKKALSLGIQPDPALLEFLASNIRSNIRSLEGALTRIASYMSIQGGPPSGDALEKLLRDILQKEARRSVSIDQIQKKVAEQFDVRLADMTSRRRPANIAFPRQVAMYLAREMTRSSLNEIGEAFGGRDHGTVLHAHRLVAERLQGDSSLKHKVLYIQHQLER